MTILGENPPEEVTRRLESLFRLGTDVALAETEGDVLEAIVGQASGIAGAFAAVVGLLDGDQVRVAAAHGYEPGHLDSWTRFPLTPGTPMSDVIAEGRPTFCRSREDRDRLWPLYRGVGTSVAFALLPLLGRGGVVGALSLGFGEEHDFDVQERSFLQAFAAHGALAIERAKALAAERLARERTERLQRFSTRLAPAMTVDAVAEIAVDKALVASRAATALLALATGDGSQIEVRRIDGRVAEGTLSARFFPLEHRSAIGEVFRSHRPLWFSNREAWEEYPEAVARPDFLRSAAVLPLADARQFFGVLEVSFEQEHAFDEDEQKFLSAIASQTALALDRARLHEEQHHIAHVLQRSLLPQKLPVVPGIEVATRYHAWGANETGGDFYDLWEVDPGHILVVGDVCGHGAEAAALTALCRYTLRATSLRSNDAFPERLLDKLNQAILRHSPSDEDFASATCVLLRPNARGHHITIASAGHPPTLIRRRGGSVEEHTENGPLTGLFADTIYPERSLTLEPGELVLLYTDGLPDSKTRDGGRLGTDAVAATLAALPDGARAADAVAAYDRLLETVEPVDDVAIIVAAAIQ